MLNYQRVIVHPKKSVLIHQTHLRNNLSGSARPAAPRTMLWLHRNREHPSSVSPAFLHLPFDGCNRKPTESSNAANTRHTFWNQSTWNMGEKRKTLGAIDSIDLRFRVCISLATKHSF